MYNLPLKDDLKVPFPHIFHRTPFRVSLPTNWVWVQTTKSKVVLLFDGFLVLQRV